MTTERKQWVSWEELNALFPGLSPYSIIDHQRVGGLTPGSIPFADASGFLDEDNANLFWDETNARLGLNQPTPTARIDIVAEAAYPGINISAGAVGEMSTPDGQQFRWGHWNAGTTTFTERLKFDAAGIFYVSYLTTGSVLFAGAGGEIKQDNAKFFYDAANHWFALGHLNPTNILHVSGVGTTSGWGGAYGGVVARFHCTENKHTSIVIDALAGYDSVLGFSENGAIVWAIRNDASATDEFQIRYHVGVANRIDFKIDNAGNVECPTGTFAAVGITDTAVTATNMAAGTTGERPGGIVGDIRYNSTLGEFELYIAAWHNLARSGANVVFGTIGCGAITGTSSAILNSGGATGEIGLNLYSINNTHSIIAQSDAEGIANSSDLRIGLDETQRDLIICDRGDIATDFGFTASSHPTIRLMKNDGSVHRLEFLYNSIYSTTQLQFLVLQKTIFTMGQDRFSSHPFSFISSVNAELVDADNEQAWMYIEPKVLQTGTAAFDGIYLNVDDANLTYGDGSTGDGNNLLRLAIGDVTQFKIDIAGNVGMGQSTFGTNATKTLALGTGVAPTTSPADCFQMYSADIGGVAGKAGVHFRDEEGNIVSLGSGGVLMSGTARVTKQIYLNNAAFTKGSTAPTQVILGNLNGWSFDIGDDAVMTIMLPPDWTAGTLITIKACWYIDEAYAADKEIQWRIDWSAIPHDFTETVDAPTHSGQIDSGDINIPAVAKTMGASTIGIIAAANLSAGDMLGFTLSRIAVTNDDPTKDPAIHHLIIEYTADKLGMPT